jgi:hypothetical protein
LKPRGTIESRRGLDGPTILGGLEEVLATVRVELGDDQIVV